MAFPYQQYVEYSNPATPRVYAWEVASATSDQDPSLQLQHQDPQPQPQQISPSQLQLHQLPPPVLQHPQPSTPQEHQVQQQLHQQPQPQPQQHQQYAPHQTIHVQPAARTPQQPQYRFETITEEDFIQANAAGERPGSGSSSRGGGSGNSRRAVSKPPSLHVDTSRRASSSAAASPGPASAPGLGPGTGGRVPHARTKAHAQSLSAHPYLRRPQSRVGSGAGAGTGAGVAAGPSGQQQQHAPAPVRSARRVSELQSAQTSVGGVSASHTGGALPTVGTPMGVSCPASSSWREGLQLGLATGHQPQPQIGMGTSFQAQVDADATAVVVGSAGATPQADAEHDLSASHNLVLPFTLEPVQPKRYGIRADVHFSTEENVITAMFELPGVKRTDLRITMSVCPFSRVRQVTVAGVSRGTLPVQGHQVRERKFGEFFRTLAVPPETKPENVAVLLEDGILTLKIPGGAPVHTEQPQDIPIPIPAPQ